MDTADISLGDPILAVDRKGRRARFLLFIWVLRERLSKPSQSGKGQNSLGEDNINLVGWSIAMANVDRDDWLPVDSSLHW